MVLHVEVGTEYTEDRVEGGFFNGGAEVAPHVVQPQEQVRTPPRRTLKEKRKLRRQEAIVGDKLAEEVECTVVTAEVAGQLPCGPSFPELAKPIANCLKEEEALVGDKLAEGAENAGVKAGEAEKLPLSPSLQELAEPDEEEDVEHGVAGEASASSGPEDIEQLAKEIAFLKEKKARSEKGLAVLQAAVAARKKQSVHEEVI